MSQQSDNKAVNVNILDRDYTFACPAEQEDGLLASARYLDDKMREIRNNSNIVGTDRIAVMAALNIVHDLLQANSNNSQIQSVMSRIQSITAKIDNVIE